MNHTLAVQRSDEADKYLLYAKLDNAKILHNLAKAVNFKEVTLKNRNYINLKVEFIAF